MGIETRHRDIHKTYASVAVLPTTSWTPSGSAVYPQSFADYYLSGLASTSGFKEFQLLPNLIDRKTGYWGPRLYKPSGALQRHPLMHNVVQVQAMEPSFYPIGVGISPSLPSHWGTGPCPTTRQDLLTIYSDKRVPLMQFTTSSSGATTGAFDQSGFKLPTDLIGLWERKSHDRLSTQAEGLVNLAQFKQVIELVELACAFFTADFPALLKLLGGRKARGAQVFIHNLEAALSAKNLARVGANGLLDIASMVGSGWLAYSYGLKPLVDDIMSSIRSIMSPLAHGGVETISVKAHFERQLELQAYYLPVSRLCSPVDGGFAIPPSGGSRLLVRTPRSDSFADVTLGNFTQYERHSLVTSHELWYDTTRLAHSLGLDNPLLLAWELVPFSFVVDWFVRVGEWIDAICALTGVVGTGNIGMHVQSQYSNQPLPKDKSMPASNAAYASFYYRGDIPNSGTLSFSLGGSLQHMDNSYLSAYVGSGVSLSELTIRGANAAALLLQILPRFKALRFIEPLI